MTAALILLLAQSAAAQVSPGEKVFLATCAVGYCHGVGGAANRGPRLRARSFETGYVERTVRHGIPNSAMPAFESKLSETDLSAVVRYVESIASPGAPSSPSTATSPAMPATEMPADLSAGKTLFQDATRQARCSLCHQAGAGEPKAGPDLLPVARRDPPQLVAAARALHAAGIRRAVLRSGETFPVRIATENAQFVRVFDLSGMPPVLRTVRREEIVSLNPDPEWSHAGVTKDYSDADLGEIARYLRWLAQPH